MLDMLDPTTLRNSLVGNISVDDDDFVLNDIPLSVPPSQIRVSKQTQPYEVLSLRTQHPQKIPSGHGAISVSLQVYFVGNDSINNHLAPIVAGLRAAPFCAVYNKYLKQQLQQLDQGSTELFAGYQQLRPVVLAWTSMAFSTVQGMPDTIAGQFEFIWFNYLPYTPIWAYKTLDSVSPGPCYESEIWKEFYRPYLAQSTPVVWPHDSLGGLPGQKNTRIYYREFMKCNGTLAGQEAAADLANALASDPTAFTSAYKEVLGDSTTSTQNSLDKLYERLSKEGKVPKRDLEKIGSGIITAAGADALYPVLARLLPQIQQGIKNIGAAASGSGVRTAIASLTRQIQDSRSAGLDYSAMTDLGWQPVSSLKLKLDFKDLMGNNVSLGQANVYQRKQILDLLPNDYILEALTFSVSNNLAIIPMMGHTYPTCQHMGGQTVEAQIKMTLTYEALERLQLFYDKWNQTVLTWKAVPQGFHNIYVENDFFQLFGFKEFIPTALLSSTIEGQPGRSQVSLVLTTAGVTSKTTFEDPVYDNPEKLTQEKVGSKDALRSEVYAILAEHMEVAWPISGYKKKNVANPESALRAFVDEAVEAYNTFCDASFTKIFKASKGNVVGGMAGAGTTAVTTSYLDETYYKTFMALTEASPYSPGLSGLQRDVANYAKKRNMTPLQRVRGSINYSQPQGGVSSNVTADVKQQVASETFRKQMLGEGGETVAQRLTSSTAKAELGKELERQRDLGVYEYSEKMDRLITKIIDGHLSLPEFQHLKDQSNKVEICRGVMAYPDFYDSLNSVATWVEGESRTEASLLSYDPDTYMWYPLYNGGASAGAIGTYIDTNVLEAAKKHSLDIFQSAQGDVSNFFQGKYRELLAASGNQAPSKALEALSGGQMMQDFYRSQSWGSATQQDDEGGKIRKVYRPDPGKIPTNSWLEESSDMGCTDIITQTTDMQALWDGVIASTGTGNQTSSKAPDTTSLQSNNSVSWQNLGVEPVTFQWPADSQETPNSYGLVCPIETFTFGEPVKIRPLCSESDIINGLKKFERMWKTSSHIFIRDGYTWSPEMCKQDMGRPVSSWTPEDYKKWVARGGRKLGRMHQGLDLAAPLGTPIYAIAKGKIKHVSSEPIRCAGLWIVLEHTKSQTGGIGGSRYMHLQQIKSGLSRGKEVEVGECIGLCGHSGYANSKYIHLHFETWDGPAVKPIGEGYAFLDPQSETKVPLTNKRSAKRYTPPPGSTQAKKLEKLSQRTLPTDITSEVISPLKATIEEFEKDAIKGQVQRLVRAYPAFKLYFIEDDSGDRENHKRIAFDDFFSYNSLKTIRVVRSRKIAADLCIIEIINISGTLSNRQFRQDQNPHLPRDSQGNVLKEESANPGDSDTKRENPIASLLLQEGIGIHLKLGYASDPSLLEPVFTGQITAVEFSETEDLVTVIAQSYATELVQDKKGVEGPKDYTTWGLGKNTLFGFMDHASTGRILEEMLAEPEVLHFGRWERQDQTANRDLLCNRWKWIPTPADDNIFAPPVSEDLKLADGIVFKSLKFVIQNITIWDICQEMTLRHPNFICAPVPYSDKYGERMTLFFGLPSHLYFSRYPTNDEKEAQDKLIKIQEDIENETARQASAIAVAPQNITKGAIVTSTQIRDVTRGKPQYKNVQKQRLALARSAGYIKPFRKFHLVTSGNHIVANNIRTATQNVANTIAIQYIGWSGKANDAFNAISGMKKTEESAATIGTANTLFVKLDNALPTEDLRTQVCQFMNVTNPGLARRYGLGMLLRNCKEIYTGDLVILGNPSIRPYDICFLFDQANDMVGPVEVEQVIHTFSHQTGFLTEIVPDMVAVAAEWSQLSTIEALGIVMEGFLHNTASTNYNPSPVSPAAQALAVGTSLFGGFLTDKIINFTQFGQPIIMAPLMFHGRPFTGGVPTRKIKTSLFETVFGKYDPKNEVAYQGWKTDFWDGVKQSITKWSGGYSQGSVSSRLKPWGEF